MPSLRALISALTLFGGHFLNRRMDRVILIGALLALGAIITAALTFAMAFLTPGSDSAFIRTFGVPPILIAAMALFSAGLTFADARHPPGGPVTATMRFARLPLSAFGFGVIAGAIAMVLAVRHVSPTNEARYRAIGPIAGSIHYGSGSSVVTLGGIGEYLPAPPTGPERLRGRITLDGAAVKGANLTLKLNDEYQAVVESDSQGAFEVPLSAGKWRINDIDVRWAGQPQGRNLLLFSGREPPKKGDVYSRFDEEMPDGLEVSLPAASHLIPVEIEFRDAVALAWPALGYGNYPDAEFSTAAITWQPVKDAVDYEVQIARVNNGPHIPEHMLTRHVSGLSLPLASLPQRLAHTDQDRYAVHVLAFDAAGHLLTESSTEYHDRTFQLTGATRLGKERQYIGFTGPTPREVISEEYELNDHRLGLARQLLEQKRFDDARRVLEQVTSDAPPGEASSLRGKFAALQGDCATARRLFDKAVSEGGCVACADRNLCEPPQGDGAKQASP